MYAPCCRVLPENPTDRELVDKFSAFYGTRSLITAFASARTCPYPKPEQSNPYLPPSHFLKLYFNTFPSMLRFSK